MQFVSSAAQRTQLFLGFRAVGWFAESHRAACKCLIGAKNDPPGQRRRDLIGFGARQITGYCGRVDSFCLGLDSSLIDQ
jgi:hypothetical protein